MSTQQLYQHYLDESYKLLSTMKDAVILKTDAFNEIKHEDRPFIRPILGNLPNVKEAFCVEILKERAEEAKAKLNGHATVMHDDLLKVILKVGSFDAIIDCSTIDHIYPGDVPALLKRYCAWLKPGASLLIWAWLTRAPKPKQMPEREPNPNHQYYFDADDFSLWLWSAGLPIVEQETIYGSKASPFITKFICRKVTI
jgi:SAM-dependent methyltransferase